MTEAQVERVMASYDQLMPLPGQHAPWCDVASHRRDLADDIDVDDETENIEQRHPRGRTPDPPCHRAIAGDFVPEIRCCEDMPPTRAKQDASRLLPGEALLLAAAPTSAAHLAALGGGAR